MEEPSEAGRASARARIEAALLVHLLMLHPAQLTEAELICELAGDPADAAECAQVERAIHELIGVGLLERGDGFVAPSAAAIRSYELLAG